MTDRVKFPIWFSMLTALYFVSNLFVFGLATLFSPGFAFPDMGNTAAAFPIQFFAVRHIAFSIPLLHGLVSRDVKVLQVMYRIFIVMAALDVTLLIVNGYYIPVLGDFPLPVKIVIGLSLFILPVAIALRHLSGYKQKEIANA